MTEPTAERLRAVPVDVLRAWYIDRVEHSSVRAVATEAGLGRTTLHKFVARETMPHPRVRRLLALLYYRESGAMEAQDGEDARAALGILAGYFPADEREGVAADLLDALERRFERVGLPLPRWFEWLRRGSWGE